MQEWLRRTLASRARALTPTELAEIRARNAPDATTAEAFLAWQRRQR